MKKLYLVLLVLLIAFSAIPCYCAEVGNLPDKNGFELSFKSDSSEREVKMKDSAVIYNNSYYYGDYYNTHYDITAEIDCFDAVEKTSACYFKPGFTFLNGSFQLYGKLGSVSGEQSWYNVEMVEVYDYTSDYSTSHSTSTYMPDSVYNPQWNGKFGSYYGVGMKYAYEIKEGLKIGVDLQYSVSRFKKAAVILKEESSSSYESSYDSGGYSNSNVGKITSYKILEPQIALAVSKNLDDFNVYGGATLSFRKGKVKGNNKYSHYEWYKDSYGESEETFETFTDFSFETKNSRSLGLFLGGDYNVSKNFALNAEFAVGNEQRITVGGLCKF